MKSIIPILGAGIVASTLVLSPVQAQTPAPEPVAESSSFDAYQALAITAGVIGGATVAVIVTDGLIIPAYAWATGAGGMAGGGAGMVAAEAGMAGAGGMQAAGAGTAGMGVETVMAGMAANVRNVGHGSYALLRGSMRILGGVTGGLMANSWYTGE